MTSPEAAFALFEETFNRYLRLDPEAPARLAPLQGRVIRIEVLGLGLRLYFIPGPDRVQVYPRYEGEPDCSIRGTPLALARLASMDRSEDQLFSGAVQIQGDTGIGHRFSDILAHLDIDWEEQLSRFTGDVVAHQLGNQARAATRWARAATDTLSQDLKEYLQEESRLLPTRYEIEELLSAVDRLRDDIERLGARVARLQRQMGAGDDGAA